VALAHSSERSDIVVLNAPRGSGTLPVMRVVIGGVASRHALSVDRLDDVELAVETLLREEPAQGGELTLTITVVGQTFKVPLAGLRSPMVRQTLCGADDPEPGKIGPPEILRMLMRSLVDTYRTADGATAGSFAVEMEKRIL
jgi:hypothetical protein